MENLGMISGAALATLLPSNNPYLNTVVGGIVGNVSFQLASKVPRIDQVIEYFVKKPNAIFIDSDGPIYNRVETYIIHQFVKQIRACRVEPKNGEVSFTLNEVRFSKPVNDEYQGCKLQLYIRQSDGNYDVNQNDVSLDTMFQKFTRWSPDKQTDTQNVRSSRMIIVASWELDVDQLKQYIDGLCQFKENAQVTKMFITEPKGDEKKNKTYRWRELHVKSNKRIANTIISETVTKDLLEDLRYFMNSESEYNHKGIPWKRGYILHGPPGTGKTSLIKSVAAEYNLPVFIVDFEVINSNESFSGLMKEINYHTNNEAYILAFEDLDRSNVMTSRDYNDSSKVSMQCLMNEIDGLVESHGRILFITANDYTKFDPDYNRACKALMRPGRIDRVVKVDYCDFDQIQRLLFHFYGLTDERIQNLDAKHLKSKTFTPASVINLLQKYHRPEESGIVLATLFNQQQGSPGEMDGEMEDKVQEAKQMIKSTTETVEQRRDNRQLQKLRQTVRDTQKKLKRDRMRKNICQKEYDNIDKRVKMLEKKIANYTRTIDRNQALYKKRKEAYEKFRKSLKEKERRELRKEKQKKRLETSEKKPAAAMRLRNKVMSVRPVTVKKTATKMQYIPATTYGLRQRFRRNYSK